MWVLFAFLQALKYRIDKKFFAVQFLRTMKRSNVRSLVNQVITPTTTGDVPVEETPTPVIPAPVVSVPDTDQAFHALRDWKQTKQWVDNTTLRGINPQRLGAVMQSRIEAAFRAGYAAGVGDSI